MKKVQRHVGLIQHALNQHPYCKTGIQDIIDIENCKLEKGPTDKAKDPDPGGSDQQNLGYKKLKNRKVDRTVGLNYIYIFQYFVRHETDYL